MTCTRCQGCMVWSDEPVSRFGRQTLRMLKCLNCGAREDAQIRQQRRFMAPIGEDRHAKIWQRIKHLVQVAV